MGFSISNPFKKVGDITKGLVPGHKDYLDFSPGRGANGVNWQDRAKAQKRRLKVNPAAEEYGDLAKYSRGMLDRYAAWKATGDENKTERLASKLEASGVDLAKFGDQGSADAAILKMAGGGAELARRAAFLRNNSNVATNLAEADNIAGMANTQIPDEINASFQSTLNQIAAMTGGNPNSPAVQAAAAQVLAQRFGALDRAKLDIGQNLAQMKIGIRDKGNDFDTGLLSSIGDTIEMLRAQKEADQMAKYQLGASVFGGVASLGLGIGGLLAGGAASAAPAVANRNQFVVPPSSTGAYSW